MAIWSLTPFGKKVKSALLKKDMTQRWLAEQLGITERVLADTLRGRRRETAEMRDKAYELLGIKGE